MARIGADFYTTVFQCYRRGSMKRDITLLLCIGVLLAPRQLSGQSREYALILEDPPLVAKVSSRKELSSSAAIEREARIAAAQRLLYQTLAERNVLVIGSVKTLLNAVFVDVTNEQAEQLQKLPGVRRLGYLRPIGRHLDQALPLIRVPEARTALLFAGWPARGEGTKIGIIDTGIDQTHPAFRDPSLSMPAGFPKCQPDDCAYTNTKVIVARSYVRMVAMSGDASNPAATSRPDDYSARDRVGHGTAAAMVAAGVGHSGPLATISGVVPKAHLGNYKIFGSPGINDTTKGSALIAALEDAFKDGMDIVSLSVGLPAWYDALDKGATCLGLDSDTACEPEAQAVENAIAGGMTIVVSAGNDGAVGVRFPTLNSIHSPGTAPSAITVGAFRNGHIICSKVGLTSADAPSDLRSIPANCGAVRNFSRVSGSLLDIARLGDDGVACGKLGANSLSGRIALVSGGSCDVATKVRNVQSAGAIGVVVYSGARWLPQSGLIGTSFPTAIIGSTAGLELKTYLQTHIDPTVVLDPTATAFTDPDVETIASFSSRGPSIGSAGIKPEVVAVGSSIYTATQSYDPNGELYDPTGYTVVEGTSFAAPMVAGVVALVKQKNPSFSPAQLKSAVVNTAETNLRDYPGILAAGGGKVNAEAAVRTHITVEPATLSFGVITSGAIPSSRELSIRNLSSTYLTMAVEQADRDFNAHLRLSSTSVAPYETTRITVYLEGKLPEPGIYQGAIVITGGWGLRVPYLYIVADNVPYNAFPVGNRNFVGVVDEPIPGWVIALRVVDRFGVPVLQAPVSWSGTQGGAHIDTSAYGFDAFTKRYGFAAALAYMGPEPGNQELTGTIQTGTSEPLTVKFQGRSRRCPAISANGVVNAASGQVGPGLAAGSYISIWGTALSESTVSFDSVLPAGIPVYLPIALGGVSVSFDVPSQGLSVPGRLTYVSPSQLNVQIPWELRGASSALLKVRMGEAISEVYDLPLSDFSPGVFEVPQSSGLAVARDSSTGAAITTQHPAQKGQWISIYANGLGPVDNTPQSGEMTPMQPLARCRSTPSVTIGGQSATVDFAGLTPSGVGYYQINLKVPDAPSGNQPVVVSVNGVMAKTVNLPVK